MFYEQNTSRILFIQKSTKNTGHYPKLIDNFIHNTSCLVSQCFIIGIFYIKLWPSNKIKHVFLHRLLVALLCIWNNDNHVKFVKLESSIPQNRRTKYSNSRISNLAQIPNWISIYKPNVPNATNTNESTRSELIKIP